MASLLSGYVITSPQATQILVMCYCRGYLDPKGVTLIVIPPDGWLPFVRQVLVGFATSSPFDDV